MLVEGHAIAEFARIFIYERYEYMIRAMHDNVVSREFPIITHKSRKHHAKYIK